MLMKERMGSCSVAAYHMPATDGSSVEAAHARDIIVHVGAHVESAFERTAGPKCSGVYV